MPLNPRGDDEFLDIEENELIFKDEEDGWCHIVPSLTETKQRSSEGSPSAVAPSSPSLAGATALSQEDEDLYILKDFCDVAAEEGYEGEAASFYAEDIGFELCKDEEQSIVCEADEDSDEYLDSEELIDPYFFQYGQDSVLDKKAWEFGGQRKVKQKSSRQRKQEAAKRAVSIQEATRQRAMDKRLTWEKYREQVDVQGARPKYGVCKEKGKNDKTAYTVKTSFMRM